MHPAKQATAARYRSAAALLLLVVQPLYFFRRALFHPRTHIPYDIERFHLPLIAYIARCVREHVLPLWDPYPYCGVPIHADIQAQLFYPATWIAILLGNVSGGHDLFYWVEWMVPFHMILAGLFTFCLLRHFETSVPAALFGATVYQLGGYFASQSQHLGAICCGAWLPLALLSVSKLSRGIASRWVAVLALSIAMAILAGFVATTMVVVAAVALTTLVWSFWPRRNWRLATAVLGGLLLGHGVAAVQLLPTYQLAGLSVASSRQQAEGTGGGLPLESLVSLAVPNYYHIYTPFDPSRFKLPYDFTLLYAYCGVAALLLLFAAPFLGGLTQTKIFFLLTVFFAVWMVGEATPVYRLVYTHLPRLIRGAVYAEYALMGFCMCAAITGALALQRAARRMPAWLFWAVALFTAWDLTKSGANRPMNSFAGGYRTCDSEYNVSDYPGSLPRIQALLSTSTPPLRLDYAVRGMYSGITESAMLKLPTANGDNPFALQRLISVRKLLFTGEEYGRQFAANRTDSPLLSMLNVGFLAVYSGARYQALRPQRFPPAATIGDFALYRNPEVLARFFLVGRLQAAAGPQEALAYLDRPGFDPAHEAVVETKDNRNEEALAGGEVQVEQYAANQVELRVTTTGRAFLASSEVLYPGWTATVDGKAARLEMTNGAFRGLRLDRGVHQVVMSYWPEGLVPGGIISLVSAAVMLAGLFWGGHGPKARSSGTP